jgi:hypothetical protein
MAKVEFDPNSGCWLWSGSTVRRGYGALTIDRRCIQTHRLSYALNIGSPGSAWVLHRCDTPACCNPAHLFLGDAKSNVADRVAKGRSAGGSRHGERHWKARLSRDEVAQIRAIGARQSRRETAAQFGITSDYVGEILRGAKWKP